MHALSGEFGSDGRTNSATRTGYQCNFAVQSQFHVPPQGYFSVMMALNRAFRKRGPNLGMIRQAFCGKDYGALSQQSYIAVVELQERNICQKMC